MIERPAVESVTAVPEHTYPCHRVSLALAGISKYRRPAAVCTMPPPPHSEFVTTSPEGGGVPPVDTVNDAVDEVLVLPVLPTVSDAFTYQPQLPSLKPLMDKLHFVPPA